MNEVSRSKRQVNGFVRKHLTKPFRERKSEKGEKTVEGTGIESMEGGTGRFHHSLGSRGRK